MLHENADGTASPLQVPDNRMVEDYPAETLKACLIPQHLYNRPIDEFIATADALLQFAQHGIKKKRKDAFFQMMKQYEMWKRMVEMR